MASHSPTELRREPNFCGIEIGAILDLYARFPARNHPLDCKHDAKNTTIPRAFVRLRRSICSGARGRIS
jgi:hypothetical protein